MMRSLPYLHVYTVPARRPLALIFLLCGSSSLTPLRGFRPGFQLLPTALALLLCVISFLIPPAKYLSPTFARLRTPVSQPPVPLASSRGGSQTAPTAITLEAYTRRVARNIGVDEALALAILIHESDPVDPLKAGKGDSRGPLQIKPIALEEVGLSPDEHSLPVLIRGGILYLKAMLTRFRSLTTALAAYNMGPNRLEQRDHHPDTSTQRYVSHIIAQTEAIHAGTLPSHPILQYPLSPP